MPKFKSCSICYHRRCLHMDCKVCKGVYKMVCNGCIRNMLTLERGRDNPLFRYKCPHCRTKMTLPKRMHYCKKTKRRIGDLLVEDIIRMLDEIEEFRGTRV